MLLEISSAVNFISFIIEISYRNHLYKISKNNLKKFRKNLKKILKQNFKNQWFPNNPHKASSLRTLRINNHGIDPRIELAWQETCNLNYNCFSELPTLPPLPHLMLMIDPSDVSVKFENHTPSILYEGENVPWKPERYKKSNHRDDCSIL